MAEPTASIPFRIGAGFAVPFAEVEMTGAAELNARLRALFLDRESQGEAFRNPAPSMKDPERVFESRFDLFYWDEPDVVRLREFCNAAVYKVVAELSGYGPEDLSSLRMSVDAWFHVTRQGGSFGLHNHPMASWSGVYCVDSGYGDDEPQSGELLFLHPLQTSAMFMDLGVANVRPPWAIRPKSYRLRPGQLVVFPSWLMHEVRPYTGEGERITVAFNCWFRREGPQAAAGQGTPRFA